MSFQDILISISKASFVLHHDNPRCLAPGYLCQNIDIDTSHMCLSLLSFWVGGEVEVDSSRSNFSV